MKRFTGFSKKEKRFNKIYVSIFGSFLLLSIFGAATTPEYDELSKVSGKLESFECIVRENLRGNSQWVEVTILSQSGPISFTYNERCRDKSYPYEKGMSSVASYGKFGFNEALYELKIADTLALEYQEAARRNYNSPFGLVFVFGLPWAIWALIRVARS